MPQVKAIAFDLDDTLIDTSRLLIPQAQAEAFAAMKRAGLPASDAELKEAKRIYQQSQSEAPDLFSFICHRWKLSAEATKLCIEAAEESFYRRQIPDRLEPFPGVYELLAELKPRYALYLVTSGDPVTQVRKIVALNLQDRFKDHFCINSLAGENKTGAFEKILEREELIPGELLSVGNRRDKEIEEAKLLGCQTCLLRHGEYDHLKALNPYQKPDYEITNIVDLISLCHL